MRVIGTNKKYFLVSITLVLFIMLTALVVIGSKSTTTELASWNYCKVDSDCVHISDPTDCGTCSCGWSVNKQSEASFIAKHELYCKTNPITDICDINCAKTTPVCVQNTCTLRKDR